jgi:toxin ParE1/3/4
MRGKYVKSNRAARDIEQIVMRSMEDFGELQTDKYVGGLEDILSILADTPEIGLSFLHDETKTEYHRYRYISHMVYYRKRESDIFIVRILHIKMLPAQHL